jgi:pimeloyl-ACP methyl ester carboxylesterase
MGLAANADALEEMLEAVGAENHLTVVGHSLGGGVALELALRHKGRVGALVLVGSVGVAGALSGFDRLLVVPMVGSGILRAGTATLRRGLITATRYSERHPDAKVARKVAVLPTLQAAIGSDGRPIIGRSRRSFLVEQRALLAETPQLERSLAAISVPTAVVSGASDHIVPTSAARALAGRIPSAELIVVPGGHLLPFEQPARLAEIVRRYCELAAGVRDGLQRRETPEA